jgi:hypothetical protein
VRLTRIAAVLVMTLMSFAHTVDRVGADVIASPTWAPAATAPIHPGVQTTTGSGGCTANFVFYDATNVYIGQAAHCSSQGLPNDTNGCTAPVLPLGTPVQIDGATAPGTVVYNSWIAMREAGVQDSNLCFGNDFALVKLDPADHARVNPSIPAWGGPIGLDPSAGGGEAVYAYGNSSLRGGIGTLSRQFGFAVFESNGGWTHTVYMLTPGIPGDSGSAYMGSNGGALGVLSTISATLSNQVADLSRALQFMRDHSDLDTVQLANGTVPFSGALLNQATLGTSALSVKRVLGG